MNNKKGRRKLQGSTDVYCPLKIYLDLTNFNYTFPNDTLGEDEKNNLLLVTNNAISFAEKMFKILVDIGGYFDEIEDQNREDWGLDYWDEEIYQYIEFTEDNPNYFIAFKFNTSITNCVYSTIVQQYASMPLIGVITFHPDKIKSSLNDLDM